MEEDAVTRLLLLVGCFLNLVSPKEATPKDAEVRVSTTGHVLGVNVIMAVPTFSPRGAKEFIIPFVRDKDRTATLIVLHLFGSRDDKTIYYMSRPPSIKSYSEWRTAAARVTAYRNPLAQAVFVRGAGMMRYRDSDGAVVTEALGGTPATLSGGDSSFEILEIAVSGPAPLMKGVAPFTIFVKSRSPASMADCRDLTARIAKIAGVDYFYVEVRTDTVFAASELFPLVFPFVSGPLPEPKDLEGSSLIVCGHSYKGDHCTEIK